MSQMKSFTPDDFCDCVLQTPTSMHTFFSRLKNYNTTTNTQLHRTIKTNIRKHWKEMIIFAKMIKEILDNKGYCVVRGFSVNGKDGDLCLLSLSLMLGEPTATDVVKKKIIWSVKPRRYVKGKITTISENVYGADLHTDTQYFPHPEKYVILACITPAKKGGVTTLVDGRKVITWLNKAKQGRKVLSVLRNKNFPIRIPTSYTKSLKDTIPEVIFAPLLSKTPLIRFRLDTLVWGMRLCPNLVSREMIKAITYFHSRLESYREKKSYKLKKGEVLITNNHVILHGRTTFKDTNRFLKRIRIKA